MTPMLLLVDPDPENSSYWARRFHNLGYQVLTALNGDAAVEVCSRLRPDLVLLHSYADGDSALVTCRRIKDEHGNHLMPVVLVSTSDSKEFREDALEAGVDEVLSVSVPSDVELLRVQGMLHLRAYVETQSEAVLISLARSIESRDPYTDGHCDRISDYAVRLGRMVGLGEEDLRALSVAGTLHDLGKVAVPDSILLKPGPLTAEERAILQQHPVVGEHICSPLKALSRVLPIIRHHHERMDGSGYPDGLRKHQIPITARIVQTVDIYDALTTDRPYRQAMSRDQAIEMMREEVRCAWADGELVALLENMTAVPAASPLILFPAPAPA